jgi:5-methylcytosine-specific restriction endonuclease McrA
LSSKQGEVPTAVRRQVIERDGHCCRLCGVYAEYPEIHHIIYRSQRGRGAPDGLHGPGNLVSLDRRCHETVHRNKPLWMPVLQQVALTDGVNGLSLLRWYRAKERHGQQ